MRNCNTNPFLLLFSLLLPVPAWRQQKATVQTLVLICKILFLLFFLPLLFLIMSTATAGVPSTGVCAPQSRTNHVTLCRSLCFTQDVWTQPAILLHHICVFGYTMEARPKRTHTHTVSECPAFALLNCAAELHS